MAHITSIKIEGLLGRKERIEIDLKRDVNVFFGNNGSGKTTLLKILDAALSRDPEIMEQLPVKRAEITIYSINEGRDIKHIWERKAESKIPEELTRHFLEQNSLADVDAIRRGYRIATKTSNSWKLTPKLEKHTSSRWLHRFLPTARLYLDEAHPHSPTTSNQLSEQQLDNFFAESINRTWLIYNTQTLQKVRSIQEEGLRAVLENILSPKLQKDAPKHSDLKAIFERATNFLSRQPHAHKLNLGSFDSFKKRYNEDEGMRSAINNLDHVERQIEVAMAPTDKLKTTVAALFSQGKTLSIANSLQIALDNGSLLTIGHLSSGEKHLIKILLAAITAESSTIIIDEPELSLHIDWQRNLVKTILSINPNCQIIIASHSPEIMADLEDDSIFRI